MLGVGLRSRFALIELVGGPSALAPSTLALLPVRVFLALGWIRSGIEKLISAQWWSGDVVTQYLVEQRPRMLPPLLPLVDGFFTPLAAVLSVIVLLLQLVTGAALLSGREVAVRPALWAGIAMNVTFIALGTVNPSAFYLVMQLALLLGLELQKDVERPPERRAQLGRAAKTAGTVVAASTLLLVPLVTTLHPAKVIEDPAIMLITLGLLTSGSLLLRWALLRREDDVEEAASFGEWLS